MELLVHEKGFSFAGGWQDLFDLLADYPPETTLRDFVRCRLS
ncbi:MAG: hypothetical protein ABRQ24_09930 [Syntrophomonadaceae bacterium]